MSHVVAHIEVVHVGGLDTRERQTGNVVELDVRMAECAGGIGAHFFDAGDEFGFSRAIGNCDIAQRGLDSRFNTAIEEASEVRLCSFGSFIDHRAEECRVGSDDSDCCFIRFSTFELCVGERMATRLKRDDHFLEMSTIRWRRDDFGELCRLKH